MKKTKGNANRDGRTHATRRERPHIHWEMTIPVLSTAHIKKTTLDALEAVCPDKLALYPEGAFVYIFQPKADAFACAPELSPVAAWFRKYYPDQHWLRLDQAGDIVDDLPTFEW